jgi:DNA-binding winged helix-turn-helix (wHTH) protein/tetratricopeptide (TPR) repeat protein
MKEHMDITASTRKSVDGYRFGDFEVRIRSRMLLRRGHRIRLQELPFRLLIALLEQPGTVLSREDLKARLWGNETFVDFDGGLRVAAGKLREALGDSAAEPRFVKTVFGQGYQFVGDLSVVEEVPLDRQANPEIPQPVLAAYPEREVGVLRLPLTTATTTRRKPYPLYFVLAALLILGLSVGAFWYWTHSRLLSSGSHLALAGGMVNRTGNQAFDGTLSRALRVKLEESPYLNLVEDSRLIRRISNPDSAPLAEELTACRDLHAEVLLRGEITPRTTGYETSLSAWQCSTGNYLTTQKVHAETDGDVLNTLTEVALRMRRRLGESTESLKSYNVPIAQATTDSMSALRSFARGEEKHLQGRDNESIADYKLAADLDPSFALAYARLGAIYKNAGETVASGTYLKKAFDLRNRTTDRERLYITTLYYESATGEMDKASDAYALWHSVYPRDASPLNNLAWEHLAMGDASGAIELAKQAVQLYPTSNLFDSTLAMSYFRAGNYEAVDKLCQDPAHNASATFVFHETCYLAAVEQNNIPVQKAQLLWVANYPDETGILNDRAWAAIYAGEMRVAKSLFEQNIAGALRAGLPDVAAQAQLDYAILLADSGRPNEAKLQATAALHMSPESSIVMAFAALVMARTGDIVTAGKLSDSAAKSAPLDTVLNDAVLPTVRAAIDLARHDPTGAIVKLEPVRRFDFCVAMQLEPAYYRGLAEEEAGHPHEAMTEFQRVIDHRALAPRSLYVALSFLELARLQDSQKNAQASTSLSAKLNQIWATADEDFPPLVRFRQIR